MANKMIIRIKIMRTRIIHLLENIRLFRRMHRAGTAAPAESPIQKPGGSNKQNAHLPFYIGDDLCIGLVIVIMRSKTRVANVKGGIFVFVIEGMRQETLRQLK